MNEKNRGNRFKLIMSKFFLTFVALALILPFSPTGSLAALAQEGTLSEAIDRINVITISDNPTREEEQAAISQMREALSDPILELKFSDAFDGFTEEYKQDTYSRMVYLVKYKPFLDQKDVQAGLDYCIQETINLRTADEEMPKYEQTATIPDTVKAGDDITDQIIRLIEGNEKNPLVMVTAKKVLPMKGSERPVEYLQLDPTGRVILVKPNNTGMPVKELVHVWFTVDDTSTGQRVEVTIQPKGDTGEPNDNQIVQDEVNKYNRVASISATTEAGVDVTEQIIRLKEGMSKNPNVQVQIHQIEGMGGGNKPAQYLRADQSGRIYLVQQNTTSTTLYEHVKIMFTTGTASQIFRIDVDILPKAHEGGLSDREILMAESDKYYKSALIGNTSKVGEDVTDQIIRLIEGTQKNPAVGLEIVKVEGMGGGGKPAQYLQLDESGRIKLMQENLTNSTVYEHVHVTLKVGTSATGMRIDVYLQPKVGNDGTNDMQIARAESDKYHGNVIIPSTSKVGEDVTDQIIRMMDGPVKNPAVTVKLHKIEGMGGNNKAAEYFQADESGRIKLIQENNSSFTVFEHVQIMFTVGNATTIKYVDVLFQPKTGAGQKTVMEVAIAESDKYYRTATISNTSVVGEDVTDQIIRMIEGSEKNPHVSYKVRQIEGMGGANKPAQYLQLDDAGRIKLLQQNTTNTTLYEHVKITFTAGTASTTTRIDVTIPPKSVEGGKTDLDIAMEESEKYYKSALIRNTSQVGEDVTDQIIRMIEGTQKNPVVANKVLQIAGRGGVNSQYLKLDESGRIRLMQANQTNTTVYENVTIRFQLGNSGSTTYINVYIQPQTGGDGLIDRQAAHDESEKYYRSVMIPSTSKVGEDVTDQIIRMIEGPERNPAVGIKVHKIEGMGEGNTSPQYLQADESGRIKLMQENNANYTVFEHVQIMFTTGTASTIKYVEVLFQPKSGKGEKSIFKIAKAELNKYYRTVNLLSTSQVGEDVTD
ncbi:hypothetical protein [Brevibacillus formosus]|uniref:hypothetical protein n=2 Tax=Brevibacillus TaxID=55080 RepID=UPI000D0F445B|nr:hypothetical protein C7R94_07555 [Brevibacillus sp. NRRL NRS-603]